MRPKMMRSALPLLLAAWIVAGGCVGQHSGEDYQPLDEPTEEVHVDQPDDPFDDGRQLFFYYGPMKLLLAESILFTLEQITGHHFGSWDYTAPDPLMATFDAVGNREGDFYLHCLLLGGCMEHRVPQERTSFVGVGYVLQFEKAVVDACNDLTAVGIFPGEEAPGADVSEATIISIIEHQYVKAFGTGPTEAELERSIAYFEGKIAHETEVTPPEDTPGATPMERAGRGHCRAILATNRFLFY